MEFGTHGARSRPRRRADKSRGAVLIEFALVLPVLICILFGTITGGFALSTKNSMTNATREGARIGATLPNTSSWGTSVRDRVVDLAGGDLANSEVCARLYQNATTPVLLQSYPASPTACPFSGEPSIPASTPIGDCVVKVWVRSSVTINAFFFTIHPTVTGRAVGQYERQETTNACP